MVGNGGFGLREQPPEIFGCLGIFEDQNAPTGLVGAFSEVCGIDDEVDSARVVLFWR